MIKKHRVSGMWVKPYTEDMQPLIDKHNEAINEYKSRFYEEELNNNSDVNIYVKPDGYGDDEVPDNASSTNE